MAEAMIMVLSREEQAAMVEASSILNQRQSRLRQQVSLLRMAQMAHYPGLPVEDQVPEDQAEAFFSGQGR